jgi:ribosomal protein L40E
MNNKLLCLVCYAEAVIQAYGNSYCKKCYEQSPYYAEAQAKKRLNEERKEREK